MPRILVIDPDRTVLHSLRQAFSKTAIQVVTARTAHRALAVLRQRLPDLLVAETELLDEGVWSSIGDVIAGAAFPPIVATVAAGSSRAMIEAAKRGAVDVLPKPLDYSRLLEVVERTLESVARTASGPPALPAGLSFIAGCPAMHDVVRQVGRAASRDVAVLFGGETGTGKTHLARVLRRHDVRGGRYKELELAGKSAERIERELFGYERGAFAQADARRLGWLERCHGGVLFFDEIDTLPLRVQSRLLSALEEQCLRRLGGDESLPLKVRILAATRVSTDRLLAEGRVRADLYHHLRDFLIALPPLRERLDDLPQLVAWFLTRSPADAHAARVTGVTEEVLDLLRRHTWPGNLWELHSVLLQAACRCPGRVLVPDDLPEPLRPARRVSARGADLPRQGMEALDAYLSEALKTDARQLYPECVALFDRFICGRVMEHTGGNQSRAARILGMTRRSLRMKIRRFDPPHKSGWAGHIKPPAEHQRRPRKAGGPAET